MSLVIQTTTNAEDAAQFIANAVSDRLKSGKKVLLFIPGGSSIVVAVKVVKLLRDNSPKDLIQNLTVTLTDERFGEVGHRDSNWQQLLDRGFDLPWAKLIPVLEGGNLSVTTEKFNTNLEEEFGKADYKIGLFGIGKDGHTSGILPGSLAVSSLELACGYDTHQFPRITTTPKAIEKLDVAVAWVQGEDKWKVIEDLQNDKNINEQPAQILKKVPILTIFTDYQTL